LPRTIGGANRPGRKNEDLEHSAAHPCRAIGLAPAILVYVRAYGMIVERLRTLTFRLAAIVVVVVAASAASYGQSTDEAMTSQGAAAEGESPWSWLKMPKVTMPRIEMPKLPEDPLAPVKASAKKVGNGAKKAWEGTRELFTFGGSTSDEPRVASRGEAPSMWQRMFGAKEKPPEGPQTITEWMSQPRVDQ
jgi:hypothetical protein